VAGLVVGRGEIDVLGDIEVEPAVASKSKKAELTASRDSPKPALTVTLAKVPSPLLCQSMFRPGW